MNELDFGASLAATALLRDVFWGVEPMWGNGALLKLLQTNASQHVSAFNDRGLLLSLAQNALQKDGQPNAAETLPAVRGIADTSGATKVPFGQNADGTRKPYPVDGGVALLAITGPLSKEDAPSMEEGTSTVRARRIVRMAKADGDVKATRVRFDTPGGAVRGNDDLARDIRELALTKPTYAYCEDMCASAGYYLASQCNAIYANPSALIGSIATIMTFWDFSKMLEMAGVKVDVIVPDDAPYKGTGTPGTSLSPDQRAYYQGIAVAFAAQFRSAVQAGRGLTDEQMKSVSDGRVFTAPEAKRLKLIDGICSDDAVIAKLKTYRPLK